MGERIVCVCVYIYVHVCVMFYFRLLKMISEACWDLEQIDSRLLWDVLAVSANSHEHTGWRAREECFFESQRIFSYFKGALLVHCECVCQCSF